MSATATFCQGEWTVNVDVAGVERKEALTPGLAGDSKTGSVKSSVSSPSRPCSHWNATTNGWTDWDADTTNPSLVFLANGTAVLAYRGCGYDCDEYERIGISVADRWVGVAWVVVVACAWRDRLRQ